MDYITAKEAAEKWEISVRRVQYLCEQDLVPGAVRHGRSWAIPAEAEKPGDGRFKRTHESYESAGDFVKAAAAMSRKEKELFNFLECFPYPVQVYVSDGTMVFTNEACLSILHIPSKEAVEGKFNVLDDPVIDAWGENVRQEIAKSFRGEIVRLRDIKIPIPDIIDRFETGELCFDSSFQNITCFPVFDEAGQIKYVVHLFFTTKLFNGREDMVKAREYIETNWLEEFDLEKVAAAVNLSRYHFARLFKKHTSMTPYSYYQEFKIGKLKEALCDENLSVSEAFSRCGVSYNGNYAKTFRDKVGMTPSQYRSDQLYKTAIRQNPSK